MDSRRDWNLESLYVARSEGLSSRYRHQPIYITPSASSPLITQATFITYQLLHSINRIKETTFAHKTPKPWTLWIELDSNDSIGRLIQCCSPRNIAPGCNRLDYGSSLAFSHSPSRTGGMDLSPHQVSLAAPDTSPHKVSFSDWTTIVELNQ